MAPQTRLQAKLLSYHIVPLIVLDCVALVFREEMGPFIDEVTREADHLHTMGFRHPKDCRRDLKSMSLVHRVWTGPAQRALRYRVVLTSSESTERFLTNQMCGPWIRELWIKIPEEAKNEPELEPEQVSDSDTDSSYEPSPEDDVDVDSDSDFDMDIVSSDFDVLDAESIIMPYHFCHVLELLKRTPNLRFLAVELGELFQEIGQLSIERILHSISQMSQLEGLCFLPSTKRTWGGSCWSSYRRTGELTASSSGRATPRLVHSEARWRVLGSRRLRAQWLGPEAT
ncbi:hypothetical protein DFH11DRAFT_1734613 [Phellopilus nigrolimitatus]|nr:hypothetical protein DFH11DRAFT_1734613 [Phellopilus nigrolimitatus]